MNAYMACDRHVGSMHQRFSRHLEAGLTLQRWSLALTAREGKGEELGRLGVVLAQ